MTFVLPWAFDHSMTRSHPTTSLCWTACPGVAPSFPFAMRRLNFPPYALQHLGLSLLTTHHLEPAPLSQTRWCVSLSAQMHLNVVFAVSSFVSTDYRSEHQNE